MDQFVNELLGNDKTQNDQWLAFCDEKNNGS